MLKKSRSSCSSMSLLCILWLLIVCVAPGSWGQRQSSPEKEQQTATAQLPDKHTICYQEGCYAVFFQKKIFREAGQACREHGGTLATMHTYEAAGVVHELMSAINPQGSRSKFRVWIGLHRAPRQCSATRPLRGFVWVTGNQEGQFTNWIREEMPKTCAAHRCVAMAAHTSEIEQENAANYKWIEGPCAVPLDGYICQYSHKATCSPLKDEGRGPAVYTTPFKLVGTLLTHVPFGSVATLPCPIDRLNPDAPAEQIVLCVARDDETVGWSKDAPLCSSSLDTQYQDWCSGDHGCEQHCQNKDQTYYCYCSEGFVIDEDGYSCKPDPLNQNDPPELSPDPAVATARPQIKQVCVETGCEYDCSVTGRGVRCTCPPGFQISPDGRRCADVDECQQHPCHQLCVNTRGTFHCTCFNGFQPDNDGECVDVDECLDDGSCEGSCKNTIGSFTCQCEPGYELSGDGDCLDVDECLLESPCHHQCFNQMGGYRCECDDGFELSGDGDCLDVDECLLESPCQHQCFNQMGGYRCECDDGFELQADGFTCQASSYDEEYSTLTPDSGISDEYDIPWSTTDPYSKDSNYEVNWQTEAPEGLTPDMAHQSDNHLNQWDDLSPMQYQTPQPPTHKTGTNNDIEHDVKTRAKEPSGGVIAETGSSSGTGESEAPMDTNSTSMAGESAAGKRKHDKSWLLVALLVPLCVFLVVMLALGIVYCTSCAVDKSLRFSDCYRWVLPSTPPSRKDGKTQA